MNTCEIIDNGRLGESLRDRALRLVIEHEWIHEDMGCDGHRLTCPECSASYANAVHGQHDLIHDPGCEWGAICADAKRDPLVHYADNDSEECDTVCDNTKARDIITTARVGITCPACRERNGIRP